MSDKKGWGSTVAGWFIEREMTMRSPAQRLSKPADRCRIGMPQNRRYCECGEYTNPSPTQRYFKRRRHRLLVARLISVLCLCPPASTRKSSSVWPGRPSCCASLPADTDAAVKKQIVEASLKAFGVPIEKIIEASVEEIQALDGYIRNGAADNEKLIQESDARIKQYEAEINNIRGSDAAERGRTAELD